MAEIISLTGTNSIAEIAALIAVAIIGAVFGIQKVMKGWKENSAESSIISLMHTELSRLSEHNQLLATELAKFQLEVVSLNKQLNELTLENNRLHVEVVTLTTEVNRLQKIIETAHKE